MKELKEIATKILEVYPPTQNYDKAIANLTFPEKHYLPKGTIPQGVKRLVVKYYIEQ